MNFPDKIYTLAIYLVLKTANFTLGKAKLKKKNFDSLSEMLTSLGIMEVNL